VAADGRLVVAAGERALCFDGDGRLCWSVDLNATVRASPVFVAEAGRIVMGLVDGRVLSLDVRTGVVAATARLPGPIYASPAVSGGRICYSTTRQVLGLSVETLAIAWSRPDAVRDHGSITLAPNGDFTYVAHGGAIVAAEPKDGGFRYELRPRTGQERLRFDGTPVVSSDGWLYCASYDGFVASFAFAGA
jgi:outer membrane protein assembly factor BamB